MTETTQEPLAPVRFSSGAGLTLVWDVFRRRPGSFLRLSVLQIAVFALAGLGQIWLTGIFGQYLVDAGDDPASTLRAMALINLTGLVGSVALIVLWAWIESLWLALFVAGRTPFQASLGAFFRILAALLIIYAIVFVAALALSIIGTLAAIPVLMALADEPGPVAITGVISLCILVPLLLFCFLVLSRFSALPALAALKGGMPLGTAWRSAGQRLGRLMAAWLVWSLAYLAVMAVVSVIFAFGPGPFLDALTAAFTNLDDPTAQYRVYAEFSRSPGQVAAFAGVVVLTNAIFVPVLAWARGIGVTLALDSDAHASPA